MFIVHFISLFAGVPPTESRPFVSMLDRTSLDLSHVSYSVLAIGDSNYPHFCRAGRQVDERLPTPY
jgi:sulfite reductase (NADPH) flavoprotein alpha-component